MPRGKLLCKGIVLSKGNFVANLYARLPLIKDKILDNLDQVIKGLAKLPELPRNPEVEVTRSLDSFAAEAKARLEGTEFSSSWGSTAQFFRDSIISLKPKYVVRTESSPHVDANGRIDLTRDDDGASVGSIPPACPKNRKYDEYAMDEQAGRRWPYAQERLPGRRH